MRLPLNRGSRIVRNRSRIASCRATTWSASGRAVSENPARLRVSRSQSRPGEVAHRLVERPLVELAEGFRERSAGSAGLAARVRCSSAVRWPQQPCRIEISVDQLPQSSPDSAGPAPARATTVGRGLRGGCSRDRAATRSKYWLSWSSRVLPGRPLVGRHSGGGRRAWPARRRAGGTRWTLATGAAPW